MNNIKVWPHMTIVAVLCALIAGLGVAFYLKHEQTAQAAEMPNAARIERVDGQVAFNDALYTNDPNGQTNTQWVAATPNQPVSVGDRIYTRDNSRTSLAFTGRNFARLNPNTALDVIALNNRRTQLALRDGSAIFDVGYLAPGELFEVGTPYGAVDFDQPGLYNVGLGNGNAIVSVLSGLAQVVGRGGSGRIGKGEMLTMLGQTAAQVVLSRLNGGDAGYLVDDYYRYQYPNYYDGRYNNYDAYLNDPYYYDPYQRSVSYQYAPGIIPGLYDLDNYGDWQNVSGYGYGWRPRVDPGWVPYQQGYWTNDYPYGPTWVSSEPWGYAPYHYGRWANVGNQWYWIPDAVNTTPQYAPALVAFVPLSQANEIGWVPLAPSEPYVPRYYDNNWQPHYLTRADIVPRQVINLNVPGAVTVVPIQDFTNVIEPRRVMRVDPRSFAGVRPVLDPLTLTPLRNAAIHSAWGRGKIDLPPGIAKKLYETRVITSVAPTAPPFRKDLARALRVDQVPEKAKREKWNLRDERQGNDVRGRDQTAVQNDAARSQQDAARRQRMAELAAQASQGNKDARRQVRQLEREQRTQQFNEQRAQRASQQTQREQQRQQAEGERVARRAQQQAQREVQRIQVPQQIERKQRPAQWQSRHEERQQVRAPQQVERRQVFQQPRQEQRQERRQEPRQEPRHQQVQQPQQQQSAPASKPEGKHGPPAQSDSQSQGGGGGKGKGKGKP